ncbi:hypothetical protein KUTeg_010175 [Tegillarca granosa]|uniref:EGF-like domain-containing protein n=1 Tax=Tegillarca granosa TaxID=220873 RepID=A0ABQ9F607_TEGGR|nr:hypothetical protein KUTeg_010175 [Tegillarca granosa]
MFYEALKFHDITIVTVNNIIVKIHECLSSPCVHGTCVSLVNKYECRCSWDAFGVNCEYYLKLKV